MTLDNYTPVDDGDELGRVYRELKPTAEDLIDALASLPPDTAITVGSNEWDGGKASPDGIWYDPEANEAFIA